MCVCVNKPENTAGIHSNTGQVLREDFFKEIEIPSLIKEFRKKIVRRSLGQFLHNVVLLQKMWNIFSLWDSKNSRYRKDYKNHTKIQRYYTCPKKLCSKTMFTNKQAKIIGSIYSSNVSCTWKKKKKRICNSYIT